MIQLLVYYVSKRLLDTKTRYTEMEKLALVLVIASRKLRHYFQVYKIEVYTNHHLKSLLQKSDALGRMLKWSVELSQFDITYTPRTSIKGQGLADFVAEFTSNPEKDDAPEEAAARYMDNVGRKLFTDDSSNENGSGAGLILVSPENHKITSAIRFIFKASNNKVKYEALLAGLKLALHLKVKVISIFCDSQFVVNQVKGEYVARSERITSYPDKVKDELNKFKSYDINQIPRAENNNADALAKLATSKDSALLRIISVKVINKLSIKNNNELQAMHVDTPRSWMNPSYIIFFLMDSLRTS